MRREVFVGIDVSQDFLDVGVRPRGERFRVGYDNAGLDELVGRLKALHPTRIVLEATGELEAALVASLQMAGLTPVVVNSRQVRDFAKATGELAKTDGIDAGVLAHFAEAIRPEVRPLPDEQAQALAELVNRRRQVQDMRVAEQNPAIQAIVVDNVYDKPIDMFNSEIHQTIGTTAIFRVVMDAEFRLVNIGSKSTALSADFSKLDPVPKYFISGRDVPSLATSTEAFYDRASQPKRLLVIDHTQYALMNGTEKREYEDQIRAFFQQHLPLRDD